MADFQSWRARTDLVRVDSLTAGTAFLAIDGQQYSYVRQDGGNSGAHHARRHDGVDVVFAGCADVAPVKANSPEVRG